MEVSGIRDNLLLQSTRVRWWLAVLGAIVLLMVCMIFTTEVFLPHLLVCPFRARVDHRETPGKYGVPFDHLDVATSDGFVLRGWFVHATTKSVMGTIVVLHGHGSCKEHMTILARLLAPAGYNAIIYDSRALGESGGKYCTFGFREKEDVARYLDEAQKRYGDLGPVGIIGTSLGSAVAIQAMAEDKRFSCGIVCSAFCSLEETAKTELIKLVHFDSPWLLQHEIYVAGNEAGFPVSQINPEQTAKLVRCPVLIIHGDQDERFPVAWGRRLYDAFPSPQKRWYLARGNGHDDMFWYHDAANVQRTMVEFLNEHMRSG